jgi:hypothetical protein
MDPCNCCAKLKSIVEIHAPVLIIAWTCPTGGIITITMGGSEGEAIHFCRLSRSEELKLYREKKRVTLEKGRAEKTPPFL